MLAASTGSAGAPGTGGPGVDVPPRWPALRHAPRHVGTGLATGRMRSMPCAGCGCVSPVARARRTWP